MLAAAAALAAAAPAGAQGCGTVATVPAQGSVVTRYSYAAPAGTAPAAALVLLPGGGGQLDLDDAGCPRALKGNSLVRMAPMWNALGLATALVDAPDPWRGEDGLAGYRADARHAEDLGRVIADVRARAKSPVWVIGTSRGSISAANAAARLSGAAAPDGVVLTSILTVGSLSRPRPFLSQTVYDLPLEKITMPTLLVGHAADACLRSPPSNMASVAARLGATRRQVVTVAGGAAAGGASLAACEGRSPHGFIGQESEVAEGIARFVRSAAY